MPPVFGRAAITLGIDPHSSLLLTLTAERRFVTVPRSYLCTSRVLEAGNANGAVCNHQRICKQLLGLAGPGRVLGIAGYHRN